MKNINISLYFIYPFIFLIAFATIDFYFSNQFIFVEYILSALLKIVLISVLFIVNAVDIFKDKKIRVSIPILMTILYIIFLFFYAQLNPILPILNYLNPMDILIVIGFYLGNTLKGLVTKVWNSNVTT